MLGHIAQDTGERTDAEACMARNGDMVLAAFECCQPKMATGLTGHPVAQLTKGLREILAGDVPRQPHAVMTSSRTKWSRMTLGSWPSSKWQRTASRILS